MGLSGTVLIPFNSSTETMQYVFGLFTVFFFNLSIK